MSITKSDELYCDTVNVRCHSVSFTYEVEDIELTDDFKEAMTNEAKKEAEELIATDWYGELNCLWDNQEILGWWERDRVVLGRWHDMTAYWGYNDEYDEVGLTLCDEDGEELYYYPDDIEELATMLCNIGSMGCYYLIYKEDNWKQIPILSGEFLHIYERW